MPVPGPRNSFGQTLGDRNPGHELGDRFHGRPHLTVELAGRSPGTMERTLRGCVLAAGQVRTLYRQTASYIASQDPFSWTQNAPGVGGPAFVTARGFQITRALRYMARSLYRPGGADNTRLNELHTVIRPRARYKPPSIAAGSVRSRPTVRNRMSSFGSRVTPLNQRVDGAEK